MRADSLGMNDQVQGFNRLGCVRPLRIAGVRHFPKNLRTAVAGVELSAQADTAIKDHCTSGATASRCDLAQTR